MSSSFMAWMLQPWRFVCLCRILASARSPAHSHGDIAQAGIKKDMGERGAQRCRPSSPFLLSSALHPCVAAFGHSVCHTRPAHALDCVLDICDCRMSSWYRQSRLP